ncbi:hypothetical protein OG625_40090 (plasmid) [Streptomyces sp. NBC_01351]|uniref:hypothetical protein n=1 Tax=Streptomyces sp. NBC_01351 TaxID=2903833 RepID=UPI002E33326D|nr:hypothetical protein [Streptomyces sp. NBC_01351]
MRCGNTVKPNLTSIRAGQGCWYCAKRGIQLTTPALLYVLHHLTLNAVKIGITGAADRSRLDQFQRHGWSIYRTARYDTGEQARTAEQAVMAQIRARGVRHYLTPEVMPNGGHTETFDADLLGPEDLWRMVSALKA